MTIKDLLSCTSENYERLLACETIDPDYEGEYGDYADVENKPVLVEACTADWYEPNPDYKADGKFSHYSFKVKCMEPAIYYVTLANSRCGYVGKYCEFHKPRIQPI